MIRRILLLIMICANITACSLVRPSTPPTVIPTSSPRAAPSLPTVIPTVLATLSPTPAPRTKTTPAIVLEAIAPPPTSTPIKLDKALPAEKVAIFQPGPGSFVTSPFKVIGRGGPSWKERAELRLIGEDGRLIAKTYAYIMANPGTAGPYSWQISFQIPLMSEAGRLEVRIHSPRDGQLIHMASVNLTLLSVGAPLVHAALDNAERLAIFSPRPDAIMEGGVAHIDGAGWTESDQPLMVEVLDRKGDTVGSGEVWLDAPAVGQLGTFDIDLPYHVEAAQYGRIVIYERSEGIPGMAHYAGVDVRLRP